MSSEKHQPYATDKLAEAYDHMMERVRETVGKNLQQSLEQAQVTAVELGELTRDEAEKVANYLHRDLRDATEYLNEKGRELRDWFRFDLQQVEERILETFNRLVDTSRIELGRLSGNLPGNEERHTGEIAGIGTLACVACGAELHFHKTGRIPPCPKCHATVFSRVK